MLIVLSGLPGVGKTTIARELAHSLAAVHVRVDSIEQARTVVADCVNPWSLAREAWRVIAEQSRVPVLEVEVVCSGEDEHRRRVESRVSDIPGHRVPTWQEVVERDYRVWDRPRLVIDTVRQTVQESVRTIVSELPRRDRPIAL